MAERDRPAFDAARSGPAPHPGDVLYRQFLLPRGLTETALARHIGRPVNAINELVCQRRSVSTEMALLLGAALGTSRRFWLDLRSDYELWRKRGLAQPPPIPFRPLPKRTPGRPRRTAVAPNTGTARTTAL